MFCKSSLYSVPYFQIPLHPDARSPASEEHRHPGPARPAGPGSRFHLDWLRSMDAGLRRHDESVKFAG
jgi:hypothetical protein